MSTTSLSLGEAAEEADWRALVEQGLKGAQWSRLVGKTADGIPLEPLYREPDIPTARDEAGMPGGAPFIRGARAGAWAIRQIYDHADPLGANEQILADLEGGVSSIEIVSAQARGGRGVRIENAADFDRLLAGVILEAAPVALDGGAQGVALAELLAAKLRGAPGRNVAFNIDPIGTQLRTGGEQAAMDDAVRFAMTMRAAMPEATTLRVDARMVHEAGGSEAQEIAAALSTGIAYLRALTTAGLAPDEAARTLLFTLSVGPDMLIEAAKLRALRLCWARVLEASGAAPEHRYARIHAVTSRRMMTRYDSWTNIVRITTAAFGAGIGGADAITTLPFTDPLGLPTPFARRVARNTQHVLLEESRLGHVADPAGGAWFVEKLTHDLAALAWSKMQAIEAQGGIGAALPALAREVEEARTARLALYHKRQLTITGVSDFPLLDAPMPDVAGPWAPDRAPETALFQPIRWAEAFERLRDAMEQRKPRPAVYFATLGPLAQFGPRAQFARNLFAAGGVASVGEEEEYASRDQMIDAFRAQAARVAVICGTDAAYAEAAENAAQRLKAAGAHWVVLAGKPGDSEAKLRAAGVDQFVYTGQNVVAELETLQQALGVSQ